MISHKVDVNIEFAHIYASSGKSSMEDVNNAVEKTLAYIKYLKSENKSYCLSLLVDDYNEDGILDAEYYKSEISKQGLAPDFVIFESKFAGKYADFLISELDSKVLLQEDEGDLFFSLGEESNLAPPLDYKSTRSKLLKQDNGGSIPNTSSHRGQLFERNPESEINAEKVATMSHYRKTQSAKTEILLKKVSEDGVPHYACPLLAACWYLCRLGISPYSDAVSENYRTPFYGERLVTIVPTHYLKVEATAYEIISSMKSPQKRKIKSKLNYLFHE